LGDLVPGGSVGRPDGHPSDPGFATEHHLPYRDANMSGSIFEQGSLLPGPFGVIGGSRKILV
jgi:hypothetical protein